MGWKKIFVNDKTNKGLISKICTQLIKLNNRNKKKKKHDQQRIQEMVRRPE